MFNFIKNIFSKDSRVDKTIEVENDLSLLKTDIHSHLVPGVDDGAKDLDTAIALVRRLHELGYSKIVTTPHIFLDLYPNTPETLRPAFAILKEKASQLFPDLEIALAAEYFLDTSFLEALDTPNDLLTIDCINPNNGNKLRLLLFELSFQEAPNEELLEEVLKKMKDCGITPLLAHCARYPYWYTEKQKLRDLHSKGVILSINAATLAGNYGEAALKMARFAIDEGLVRMVCSDTHAPHHIVATKQLESSVELKKLLESGLLLNSGI